VSPVTRTRTGPAPTAKVHKPTIGSVLVNWMRFDPQIDALRGRQCCTDVDRRVYAAQ
jgi:hypothetical protein